MLHFEALFYFCKIYVNNSAFDKLFAISNTLIAASAMYG